MTKFLDTTEINHYLSKIIDSAEEELFVVSPYLKIPPTYYRKLKECNDKGVKITFIYGKNPLEKPAIKQIKSLNNVKLYFFEDLHAKCYLNENYALVTSMNLYEYSQTHNEEMGILLESDIWGDCPYNDVLEKVKWYVKQSIDQSKLTEEEMPYSSDSPYWKWKKNKSNDSQTKSTESKPSSTPKKTPEIKKTTNARKTTKRTSKK